MRVAHSADHISTLVKKIHSSNKQALKNGSLQKQLVIANTGVGTVGIANLFKVPGASASILETITTYAYPSTDDFLRRHDVTVPDGTSYSCFERAQSLALASWRRAAILTAGQTPIGVGMTGSIITVDDDGNPRLLRGGHRADLVIYTSETEFKSYRLDMQPGLRDRDSEETLCGNFLVTGIYDALMGTNEIAHIHMEQLLAGDQGRIDIEKALANKLEPTGLRDEPKATPAVPPPTQTEPEATPCCAFVATHSNRA
jgi:hypothetical protein